MQPPEEPPRCLSSCDVPALNFNAEEADLLRLNSIDPRYAMYRWDCSNYPYFKVPIPVNSSSSSASGVQIPFPGNLHGFPGGKPHSAAPEVYCGTRESCYADGHEFFSQAERCICNPHEPRYLPHHNPIHWDSMSAGRHCCGQHVMHPIGANSHSHHVDPSRLYVAPICGGAVPPDGVRAYSGHQESIDKKRFDAPVPCLPDSSGTSTHRQQPLSSSPLIVDQASCCDNPSSSNELKTEELDSALVSDAKRSNDRQESKKALQSVNEGLKSGDQNESMTNIGLAASCDPEEKQSPARKVVSASQLLPPGQNPGLKATSKSSGVYSQVTPLYGRPSWWGDEPEQEASFQWKYNPLSVSVSCPSSSNSSFSSVQTPKTKSESAAGVLLTTAQKPECCSSNEDAMHSRKSVPETPSSFDSITKPTDRRFSEILKQQGNLCISDAALIAGTSLTKKNFDENTPSDDSKNLGHSPPERDNGRKVHRFVYPDPPPSCSHRVQGDLRLISSPGGDSDSHRCKAPTAFIVDLERSDINGGSGHRITVKTRLSEFLPRQCERSIQRRLSCMKRLHLKSADQLAEITDDDSQVAAGGRSKTRHKTAVQERQRFKSKDSELFKDSFEDVVLNDAIADDVSDAGTYTIDVSTDSESVAICDARERILAEFGISEVNDAEPNVGEWCSSIHQSVANSENVYNNFDPNSDRFRSNLNECMKSSVKSSTQEREKSDEDINKDPGTPTIKNCWMGVIDNDDQNVRLDFTKENCSCSEDQERFAFNPTHFQKGSISKAGDVPVVLTIYTEAASGCIMSRRSGRREKDENFLKDVKNSARSIRSLDTAVLLVEDDESLKPHMTCDTWRSQATMNTGILLQDPEIFSSGKSIGEKLRQSGTSKFSSVYENKISSVETSVVLSDAGRKIVPIEKGYFHQPTSPHLAPVVKGDKFRTKNLDYGVLEVENPSHRRSVAASESGDSLESYGSASFQDSSPRTDASLDTQVLLHDSKNMKTISDEFRTSFQPFSDGRSLDSRSDLDEDGSSVDPMEDLISARTVASVTTEVLLKPTQEFIHAIESSKVHKHRKLPSEHTKVIKNSKIDLSTEICSTGSELSSSRSEIIDESKLRMSSRKQVTDVSSAPSEKPATGKHPKTKPPTPKLCAKGSSAPNYRLSTRRCFSDLDMADHDETVSENMSIVTADGKGSKGIANNSFEHTRMNRTFALRCARREASDGDDTQRSDVSNSNQRYNRTSKRNGASTFDVQRSRSASRSRPSTSPKLLVDSPRSTDTYVSLGQRIVRKSQDNEKKSQSSSTENSSFSRSFSRNDDSSSLASQKSAQAFRAPSMSTKKKNKADPGKVDTFNGLAVKGNTLQSHPSSLPEASSNEWTRRKKYNPKQSLKADVSAKKTGKPDGHSFDGKTINLADKHDRLDQKAKSWKKSSETNSLKSGPSTSSDWTDDEKLHLTPRGRDLPAVCQLSAKVKLLSDQVLQALRKQPEYNVNETLLQSATQKASDLDSLDGSSPEFLYIFHNLQAAERQMSAVFQVLSSQK